MPISRLQKSSLFSDLLKDWAGSVKVFEGFLRQVQLNIWLYDQKQHQFSQPQLKQKTHIIPSAKIMQMLDKPEIMSYVELKPADDSLLPDNSNQVQIYCQMLVDHSYELPIGLVTAALPQGVVLGEQEKLLIKEFAKKIELQILSSFRLFEQNKHELIEKELRFHKYHDFGTGFLNRFALERELDEALAISPNHVAIIYVGFENAKNLQSQFNLYEWENVLKSFAEKLSSTLKKDSIEIARPNATDIVFLLRSKNLREEVEDLCDDVAAVSKSIFSINNQTVHLHTHIGVAFGLGTTSVSGLINQASSAMLNSRDTGQKYSVHSNSVAEAQTRIQHLESYLLKAVRNGDLMLYFQPKVNPITKRWLAAEALLRWRHPLLGEISSETLVKLAEKNGLIFEVGSFVLKTAIEKAAAWKKYAPNFKVAVNVSAKQLKDVRFVQQVEELLHEHNLSPHSLEIEVTESGLITDEEVANEILLVLHKLGITLSLDDFGTGYASFNYLKKFPFDCIKIDKSFMQTIEDNRQDQDIVKSIIQVAKKLDLQVIIEGVETVSQERFIIDEGCDYGQGYLYGKPMPAHIFEEQLRKQLIELDYQ
ncbi:bifunctional diguanylate cyclase/phosphodiesterase [Vibrio sp.]|uniref:GGDEF domain-containing protein n=1 Tax=Vibrio viridaestus TaxID=2487322 RepID=A0A3N9TL05_9VIBR|nr:bifunctional diguanylate cyclase/phosphodiesterase [Vibrio viridaestus]MDC0612421.1 bifunctional diguanylate cyclase/phosphodiesterase [Vibrio sp.]RQW64801.1 GGDEF domain-containing protein [Vibrio viridaestus]